MTDNGFYVIYAPTLYTQLQASISAVVGACYELPARQRPSAVRKPPTMSQAC